MGDRPLHGGCHCGRNRYVIQFPPTSPPQVLFDSRASHRSALASPLSAYLRVPLAYVRSTTRPFFPDETNAMIHRVYTSPHETHSMRHFCGFCGTPLSYWSEEPRSEANFIQLTLGSLEPEDLADLEELGCLPGSGGGSEEVSDQEEEGEGKKAGKGQETVGAVPWFDTLMEGSRLGTIRKTKGHGANKSGTVKYEWEITEWVEGDDDDQGEERAMEAARSGKRKLADRENAMEDVRQ
ncbi:hypothetical protein B0T25DRAFT_566288 [Lasiosphaeria hispida]|uniref:CENP-V/GFA domain-containing protein n=1 Tax=Lasiosphaeria hispida TaxID=260671 RepID=A0AAJ0HL88_9PEZI|nr:hypothetical protein B0T25DRAFT_566288 [Lasiosphaeria hispida]